MSQPDQPQGPCLQYFPITFFAVIMGLLGLALATQAAAHAYDIGGVVPHLILAVGVSGFLAVAGLYGAKAVRYPQAVRAEWGHPVKLSFFPTVSISLLLMAAALHATWPGLAHVIWLLGAVGQGVLTLSVVTGWISHRAFELGHLTPAWFIPAVGNVVVPLAGAPLGYVELSWLFFSAGLVFWVILLTLVFNRLVFHDPIPARLFPTMVILIASPAVAFLAYVQLTGGIDPFARILLNAAYLFALIVLVQFPKLLRLPFVLSWWALSFPVAALTAASFRYSVLVQSGAHRTVGVLALIVLAVIIVGLVLRTTRLIMAGGLCQPD